MYLQRDVLDYPIYNMTSVELMLKSEWSPFLFCTALSQPLFSSQIPSTPCAQVLHCTSTGGQATCLHGWLYSWCMLGVSSVSEADTLISAAMLRQNHYQLNVLEYPGLHVHGIWPRMPHPALLFGAAWPLWDSWKGNGSLTDLH